MAFVHQPVDGAGGERGNGRRTVFLAVTHGRHAALLLRSSFLRTLASVGDRLRIVILSPNADEDYFRQEFGDCGHLEVIVQQAPWLFGRFAWVRRHLLLESKASRSHEIIVRAGRRRSLAQFGVVVWLNWLTARWPGLCRILRWVDRRVFPDRVHKHVFDRFRPDVLVVASVVHNEAFHLLRRAQLNGVPTLFAVESWDNPTCKVGFFERPQAFLVWNDLMKNELVDFHGIDPDCIRVTGTAYHDVYSRKDDFCTREQLAGRYGMDPDARWIVVAATLSTLYPDFDRFLADLEEARAAGRFGPKVQFLIRPHPQAIAGYSFGHGVEELSAMRALYPSVFFDVPVVLSQRLPVDLEEVDELRLGEILLHADVVISFFSTVTIDACVLDTPVVLPAFGDYAERTWFPTMAQRQEFNHHSNVLAARGVALAPDQDGLVRAVARYLEDPTLHREGRRRVAREQCGDLDGQGGRRMAEAALAMLGFHPSGNSLGAASSLRGEARL